VTTGDASIPGAGMDSTAPPLGDVPIRSDWIRRPNRCAELGFVVVVANDSILPILAMILPWSRRRCRDGGFWWWWWCSWFVVVVSVSAAVHSRTTIVRFAFVERTEWPERGEGRRCGEADAAAAADDDDADDDDDCRHRRYHRFHLRSRSGCRDNTTTTATWWCVDRRSTGGFICFGLLRQQLFHSFIHSSSFGIYK